MQLSKDPPTVEPLRPALDLKASLQMVGVVLTLLVSVAGGQVPHWFFLVPLGYFFLLLGVYIWPHAWNKGVERRRTWRRYRKLLENWGNFRDQIESIRLFFDDQKADGLPSLMLGLSVWLNENKITGITGQEVGLISAYLALVNDQFTMLAARAREEPTDLARGCDLVRDFEMLADSPARLGIFVILLRIRGIDHWEKAHHEILEGFKQRLMNYELFARKANREIGEEFFREHLRTL